MTVHFGGMALCLNNMISMTYTRFFGKRCKNGENTGSVPVALVKETVKAKAKPKPEKAEAL